MKLELHAERKADGSIEFTVTGVRLADLSKGVRCCLAMAAEELVEARELVAEEARLEATEMAEFLALMQAKPEKIGKAVAAVMAHRIARMPRMEYVIRRKAE